MGFNTHQIRGLEVAKFLIFFSLKGETLGRWMENPSDRAAAVKDLAQSVGGTLESYYFMFGEFDGFAIMDLPDSKTAAILSVAISSSGAFSKVECRELISPDDINSIIERAKALGYLPPGG